MSLNSNHLPLRMRVKNHLNDMGWDHFSFASITKPLSMVHYDQWIQQGQHGEMAYLKEHLPLKTSLNQLMPKAQSLIMVAIPYVPHPEPKEDFPISSLKVARYARGFDYHHWFQGQLQNLCDRLKASFLDEEFLCYTDSRPVLERDFAQQMGLGWIGKNSCLIHPKKGSLFLLGEIICSLDLGKNTEPIVPDMCGTCSRCIDACPTDAINNNRTLDARKCISYWTIESKTPAPAALSKKFDAWFFGCDICQTVCPWNEKVFGKNILLDETPKDSAPLIEELQWILGCSNKKLIKSFAQTPLTRAGGNGLKRNALVVIGNLRLKEMKQFLINWQTENETLIKLKEQTLVLLSE